jgi:uncharacterized protein YwqG
MLRTRAEIISKARTLGLSRVLADLDGLIEDSIRLYPTPIDEATFPLGITKLGGMPDLPQGAPWPAWESGSMSFIAQVQLSEVTPFDSLRRLPPRGMLYFFYDSEQMASGLDPGDGDGCKVLYFDDPGPQLVRTPFPPELAMGSRFSACHLRPSQEVTLAAADFLIEGLKLTPAEDKSYLKLLREVEVPSGPQTAHRLLGHPDQIQGDIQRECQLAANGINAGGPQGFRDPRVPALLPGMKDWRLLFQVDSEDKAGMMWGDVGRVYFCIRSKDLARIDFRHVWPVLQCT